MQRYNQIMIKFWLLMAIAITAFITVKGFQDGFSNWAPYYVFAGLALLAYLLRKFMVKRMEKMEQFQREQNNH